jgi:aromatase
MGESDSVLHVTRTAVVRAQAAQAARLIADARLWPLLFESTLHTEVLEESPRGDRLRLWAVDAKAARRAVDAGGSTADAPQVVRTWTAVREFTAGPAPAIAFRQESPAPPLTAMGGSWEFHDLPEGGCRVVLAHTARLSCGESGRHTWVEPMMERTAQSQLASLKHALELPGGVLAATAAFSGSVSVPDPDGDTVAQLADPDRWPPLPRVAGTVRVPVGENAFVVAECRSGEPQVTVCLSLTGGRLLTKRLDPPPALLAMTSEWWAVPRPGTVRVGLHRRTLLAPRRAGARARGVLAAGVYEQLGHVAALIPALTPISTPA